MVNDMLVLVIQLRTSRIRPRIVLSDRTIDEIPTKVLVVTRLSNVSVQQLAAIGVVKRSMSMYPFTLLQPFATQG